LLKYAKKWGTPRPVGGRAEKLREGTGSEKRDIAELRETQKREIAAVHDDLTEWDSDLREKLALVKEAQEVLTPQVAE
jgi:hypothetical protein